VALSTLAFQISRRRPEVIKKALRQGAIDALPEGFDVDTHFSPAYNPWDQRLCLVPNGDLFAAISAGTVDVITEHIERFTDHGIVLKSGVEIPADIIVTATGLSVQMLGGMTIELDGTPLDISTTVAYKGIMLTGVPNLAMTFGYTNASWTLKADLTSRYICRLLNEMRRQKKRTCTPEFPSSGTSDIPYIELASGYIARAANQLPKQGTKMPWRLYQNYFLDTALFRLRRVNDHMKLS
jgi:cation diffusion facilitator CzcD-associated flavoprotein CzcO